MKKGGQICAVESGRKNVRLRGGGSCLVDIVEELMDLDMDTRLKTE